MEKMEIKVVLDNKMLGMLHDVAIHLHPKHFFEFRIHINADKNYHITMNQNVGDRLGYFFYAQGIGIDFSQACENLITSFLALLSNRKEQVLKDKAYQISKFDSELSLLDEVAERTKNLKEF